MWNYILYLCGYRPFYGKDAAFLIEKRTELEKKITILEEHIKVEGKRFSEMENVRTSDDWSVPYIDMISERHTLCKMNEITASLKRELDEVGKELARV